MSSLPGAVVAERSSCGHQPHVDRRELRIPTVREAERFAGSGYLPRSVDVGGYNEPVRLMMFQSPSRLRTTIRLHGRSAVLAATSILESAVARQRDATEASTEVFAVAPPAAGVTLCDADLRVCERGAGQAADRADDKQQPPARRGLEALLRDDEQATDAVTVPRMSVSSVMINVSAEATRSHR